MVSDAQKAAIKASWSGVDLTAAGIAFYNQLEQKAPDVYAVFNLGAGAKTNPKVAAQGVKVMAFLDQCVKGIDDMGAVGAQLDTLGQRHPGFGAKKAHFGSAGPCLLAALAEVSGNWSGAAKDAWAAFYDVIAQHMGATCS